MDLFVLREFVVVLAASIAILYISNKIHLPSVIGLLLTGVLIGPGGLSLVKHFTTIDAMAEIGVVMLLFTIGLDFAPERIKRIQRHFWIGGSVQVCLTTMACVALLIGVFSMPFRQSLFYGFLVALSSTAVVLTLLGQRGELDAPHGRIALGILIFQDIAIVPMLALVPVLASTGSASAGAIALRFTLSLAIIGGVFAVARYLMPHILHRIVQTRIREVFLITTLFICLGMSFLTSSLGLSLALGAFLAGVLLADSDYSHQVVSDILPFKDVFNSLFFISVGMLLDIGAVWRLGMVVLALVGSVVVIKLIVVTALVLSFGYGSRIALFAGLSLAQIGEFSFVLARVGRMHGLLSNDLFQAFIASSILTIMATPLLIQIAPVLAEGWERLFGFRRAMPESHSKAGRQIEGHVIIAGYGLNGRNLAYVLKEAGIPYIILEVNPVTVRTASAQDEPIIYGDVASATILQEACIQKAKGIVFAISDPMMTLRGVRMSRALNPDLFVIVRTRYAADVDDFLAVEAMDVIPEEFETSIEIFTRVLERYHIPRNIIDAQVKILRSECYGLMRGSTSTVRPVADRISDLLASGTAETYFVGRGTWPVGRTLGALNLRGCTGATVIAVVRGDASITSPGADFQIQEQDTLLLVASHRDIDRAFRYLDGGTENDPSCR